MKTNKVKINVVRKKAFNLIATTSAHGFSKVLIAGNIYIAIFWVIAIALSLAFGSYQIYNSIAHYLDFEVVTLIERQSPQIAVFPAITVCDAGYYRQKTFTSNHVKIDDQFIFDKGLAKFVDFEKSSFKGEPLSSGDLQFFSIPKYESDCVRFNADVRSQTLKTVNSTSDYLILKINRDHTELVPETNFTVQSIRKGIHLEFYVDDNQLNSFWNRVPKLLKMNVNIGNYYVVSLNKDDAEYRLGEPYNHCNNNSWDNLQDNCIEICINKQVMDKHNCSIPSYYMINGTERCGLGFNDHAEYSDEYYVVYSDYIEDLVAEFSTTCKERCIKDCQSVKFSYQVHKTAANDNAVSLEFSMNDLSTLVIRQIPKSSIFDLIANVGGLMGLFIGASFLSFVEIFEFFIEIILVLLCVLR